MKILELFSGSGSVGKVAKSLGYDVVSLDLKGADINIDIMDWKYADEFKPGEFSHVWSSPPCETFSICRRSWIGRKTKHFGDKIITAEMLDEDMLNNGLPILNKTIEIIDYFKPTYWYIENPQTGRMKDFIIDKPFYDVDYCMYSDWGYKKRTRIWTNRENFKPLLCNKKCGNMVGNSHANNLGNYNLSRDKITRDLKYRVPPKLIEELINSNT